MKLHPPSIPHNLWTITVTDEALPTNETSTLPINITCSITTLQKALTFSKTINLHLEKCTAPRPQDYDVHHLLQKQIIKKVCHNNMELFRNFVTVIFRVIGSKTCCFLMMVVQICIITMTRSLIIRTFLGFYNPTVAITLIREAGETRQLFIAVSFQGIFYSKRYRLRGFLLEF